MRLFYRIDFFTYDWRREAWNLWFAGGILIGEYVGDRSNWKYRVVNVLSTQIIKRLNVTALRGGSITVAPSPFRWGQIYGGVLFGCGWAITGACPGPIFAQIGAVYTVVAVTLVRALAGTWVYGAVGNRLPHEADTIRLLP